MRNLLSLVVSLLLVGVSSSFAEVSFTTTSTRAQVNSIAGSKNDLGIQQTPSSSGQITNNAFAQVKQNDQGYGAGQASSEVKAIEDSLALVKALRTNSDKDILKKSKSSIRKKLNGLSH